MVNKIKDMEMFSGVSRLRVVSSQIAACISPYLILLDIGLSTSFVTIAMSNLLDPSQELHLNTQQALWFGNLSYITQPLGACLSGPIVDYLGRKKANFVINIPHLVAWILLFSSNDIAMLFLANGLLGIGTGIMEAPINCYVGEISEPAMRGILCTAIQVFASIGLFLMYFLSTAVQWRTAALISVSVPILSMCFSVLMPETPVWLLSRGKENEALKSLCFLRGWTTSEDVREEFDKLVIHVDRLRGCVVCSHKQGSVQDCRHDRINFVKRFALKIRYTLLRKETLRPLVLVTMYFVFFMMSGLGPIRPNMVNLCKAFGMPDDVRNIVLMVGVITFITSIVVVGVIKIVGKRKLAITAMFGAAICAMGLSIYAKTNLDASINTYNPTTFPTTTSYIPLFLFYGVAIFTGMGVPWVLLGEVFPFRTRAISQGLVAAGSYLILFLSSKTYSYLESTTQLWGTFAVYAAFAYVGTIYLYFFLPETEGKSLQEIESFYSGEFKTFADDPVINFFRRFKSKIYGSR